MGCSVLWSYWDLFRSDRLSKLIMVDEPPLCLVNESNPDGFADNDALVALKTSILNDTVNATQGFVDMMLYTPEGRAAYGRQTLEESLKFPPALCTVMLLSHVYTDWRDVIPTITLHHPMRLLMAGPGLADPLKRENWAALQALRARLRQPV